MAYYIITVYNIKLWYTIGHKGCYVTLSHVSPYFMTAIT